MQRADAASVWMTSVWRALASAAASRERSSIERADTGRASGASAPSRGSARARPPAVADPFWAVHAEVATRVVTSRDKGPRVDCRLLELPDRVLAGRAPDRTRGRIGALLGV